MRFHGDNGFHPDGVVECRVADLSDTGARLQVASQIGIPNDFLLCTDIDNVEVPCHVIWRSGRFLGVEFRVVTKSLRGCNRFSFHLLEASSILSANPYSPTSCNVDEDGVGQHTEADRRSRHERRSGRDARLDEEKFLVGERRSGVDRRSGSYRRSALPSSISIFQKGRRSRADRWIEIAARMMGLVKIRIEA